MTLTLSTTELEELTGYRQAGKQVEELHARGFWRARMNPLGRVVLERVHYEAVCSGASVVGPSTPEPRLRSIK